MIRRRALLLTVALLMACTSPSDRPTPTGTLQSPAASPSPKAPPGVFVRACDNSVFGELGRGWKKASVIMGPIAFVGLRGYRDGPDRFFQSKDGRHPGLKVLAVVTGDGVISVSIAHRDTDRVRMLYDPSVWDDYRNLYPLEAGDTTTVFGPCLTHRSTQFNGAFLVTGRTCATLEVSIGGGEPLRRLVSFGALSCRD